MTETIQNIAKRLGITLFLDAKASRNSGFCSRENSCSSAEIYVAKCDNDEIQNAIFFHELGHIFQDTSIPFPHEFQYELDAWVNGIKIGYQYGYFINPEVFFKICVPSLKSYNLIGVKLNEK